MLTFLCEMDIALTYALRRPHLAWDAAIRAHFQALRMHRPDLADRANTLLGALR